MPPCVPPALSTLPGRGRVRSRRGRVGRSGWPPGPRLPASRAPLTAAFRLPNPRGGHPGRLSRVPWESGTAGRAARSGGDPDQPRAPDRLPAPDGPRPLRSVWSFGGQCRKWPWAVPFALVSHLREGGEGPDPRPALLAAQAPGERPPLPPPPLRLCRGRQWLRPLPIPGGRPWRGRFRRAKGRRQGQSPTRASCSVNPGLPGCWRVGPGVRPGLPGEAGAARRPRGDVLRLVSDGRPPRAVRRLGLAAALPRTPGERPVGGTEWGPRDHPRSRGAHVGVPTTSP